MHFLILGIGVLLGIYGLYRFFLSASVRQIGVLFMVGGFIAVCAALFFLAVTGRLPAALGLLAALWPLLISVWHRRRKHRQTQDQEEARQGPSPYRGTMSRAEALSLLGLQEGANTDEIRTAYKRLIKKVHPDQEGSAGLAAKLNEARDILLPKDS